MTGDQLSSEADAFAARPGLTAPPALLHARPRMGSARDRRPVHACRIDEAH
ncbi:MULTISPECIES: hypothetical protein [unclassified Mycobacterium]|uniref:hypothetical protein n=1 Tax=unclassified Mycobacterium TaxID=2642494 RepID=UPI0012E7628E|nr:MULTISPECIES: hypothetical protein [unclassified Mycobacterium]